jgi:hypothetical protein
VWFYIFSTSFECGFTSSPLVSSVILDILHSFRVCFQGTVAGLLASDFKYVTLSTGDLLRAEVAAGSQIGKNTLETSGKDVKLHSFRVEKM